MNKSIIASASLALVHGVSVQHERAQTQNARAQVQHQRAQTQYYSDFVVEFEGTVYPEEGYAWVEWGADYYDGPSPSDAPDGSQPSDAPDGSQPSDAPDGSPPSDGPDGSPPSDGPDGSPPSGTMASQIRMTRAQTQYYNDYSVDFHGEVYPEEGYAWVEWGEDYYGGECWNGWEVCESDECHETCDGTCYYEDDDYWCGGCAEDLGFDNWYCVECPAGVDDWGWCNPDPNAPCELDGWEVCASDECHETCDGTCYYPDDDYWCGGCAEGLGFEDWLCVECSKVDEWGWCE